MSDLERVPAAPIATDASLLRRVQGGEEQAATELYFRYARRLQGLARQQTSAELALRVDPEEIVQSVFRTFFRRASNGSYHIPESEELWRLLLVMTLNKIRKASEFHGAARRDYRRTVSTGDGEVLQNFERDSFRDETAVRFLEQVVADLIARFPEPQARMIRMRVEGHEVEDIARATQRSKRTVERTLQTFRDRMTRTLTEEDSDGAS